MENLNGKHHIHVMIDKDGRNIKFGGSAPKMLGESIFDFIEDVFSHPYFEDDALCRQALEFAGRMVKLQKVYESLLDTAQKDGFFNIQNLPDEIIRSKCVAGLGIYADEDGKLWNDYLVMGLEDCLYIELREMILRECRIKRCKNCGKYFVAAKNNMDYCRRPFGEDGKTCCEAGYARTFLKSVRQDELLLAYTRAYKAHYARMATPRKRAVNMTREEFDAWYVQAKEKLSLARQGKISAEDFMEWLRK